MGPASGQGCTLKTSNPPIPSIHVLQLVLPAKNSTTSQNLQLKSSIELHEPVETLYFQTVAPLPPVVVRGTKAVSEVQKPHSKHWHTAAQKTAWWKGS